MPNLTIDGKEYDIDSLSEDAKAQLVSLQFVQSEIQRLESQLAVYKTSQQAYQVALKNALPN
tara:strand:- start:157 stop:342 length:186 start_codon:yes stop_codon:yes gene_type:complete